MQFNGRLKRSPQVCPKLPWLLKAHNGDAERELVKALKEKNVDIKAYHGGHFVGNRCMDYGENGDKIMME